MNETRGTGKTQRMLDAVFQVEDGSILVVAHTYDFARVLCGRYSRMVMRSGEKYNATRDSISVPGKTVKFTSVEYYRGPSYRGFDYDQVFFDHYVLERSSAFEDALMAM